MQLVALDVLDFRNYATARLEPGRGFTALVGPNGAGKTNMLDAVHYCGLCRSGRKLQDALSIRHGREGFRIQGQFRRGADGPPLEVAVVFRRGKGKELQVGGQAVPRLADHVGRLPMVFLGPEDQQLVDGYPEARRQLMDASIGQVDRPYLQALMRYNRALAQRNAVLKQSNGIGAADQVLLDSLEPALDRDAKVLREARAGLLEAIRPDLAEAYARLSGGKELPSMDWKSNWSEDAALGPALRRTQGKDEALGYTSVGPHRDDLILELDGHPARKLGSQGQKKSLLLALRLAQARWVAAKAEQNPLLLLDDVFDKLDRQRAEALFALLSDWGLGQVLLSDTNAERVDRLFQKLGQEVRILTPEALQT